MKGQIIVPDTRHLETCHRDRRTDDWNPRPAAPGYKHGSIELVEVIERPDPGKLWRGIMIGLGFVAVTAIYTALVVVVMYAIANQRGCQ